MGPGPDLVDPIQDRRLAAIETYVLIERAKAALDQSRRLLQQTRPLVEPYGPFPSTAPPPESRMPRS